MVVPLKVGKDFMIAGDPIDKRVEIGELVQYNLASTSIRGFDGEVSLPIQGCPSGFRLLFRPILFLWRGERARRFSR